MYFLKTAIYLLNRVPSKAVLRTPFELWTGRKPSLRHCMFGVARQKLEFITHKKMDSRTISGFFIVIQKNQKGIDFTVLTQYKNS